MPRYTFWTAIKFCFGLLCWIILGRLLWNTMAATTADELKVAFICIFIAVPVCVIYDRMLGRRHH